MDTDVFIEYASKRRTILAALEPLYRYSQEVLARHDLTRSEAGLLADYLVRVRHLLSQLAEAETRLNEDRRAIEVIGNLKEKYLELEGLVKEKRNSLIAKTAA
jgi:hypothetical protein